MIKKFESTHMILEVYDNKIAILPKGSGFFSPRGFKGKKEIPYSSITAVQFKEAGFLHAGYIQFTIHGGKDAGKGLLEAVRDENSFLFGDEHNQEINELKNFILNKMEEKSTNQTSQIYSIADEITKLRNLQNEGLITPEEFENLKKRIMEKV